jgi:hypothetical protein
MGINIANNDKKLTRKKFLSDPREFVFFLQDHDLTQAGFAKIFYLSNNAVNVAINVAKRVPIIWLDHLKLFKEKILLERENKVLKKENEALKMQLEKVKYIN